jgi:hypothetical protein
LDAGAADAYGAAALHIPRKVPSLSMPADAPIELTEGAKMRAHPEARRPA